MCLYDGHMFVYYLHIMLHLQVLAWFLDYPINIIRLDNASGFTSKAFNDYYMSAGIDVEHQYHILILKMD